MMLDYKLYMSLGQSLQQYRKQFLKRKNVNRYKKLSKYSPKKVNRVLNSFDRKIKGLPIFTDGVRDEYLKGLREIHLFFYMETFMPKRGKRWAYNQYRVDDYMRHKTCKKGMSYKMFLKSGLKKFYI